MDSRAKWIFATRMTTLGCLLTLTAGCASAAKAGDPSHPQSESETLRAQMIEMRTLLGTLTQRLDSIETRMGTMNDKLSETKGSLDTLTANNHLITSGVVSHPSQGSGTHPHTPSSPHDPEAGFVNDEAVQGFRKSMILLSAQKYSEAVLAFSTFLEKYPDHVLAGSAQYYVGDAYFKQKEYKLALAEFERVLTSYDRSTHVADTLREMAEAEDHLKMTEPAARHRQLLSSVFPQSPAMEQSATLKEKEAAPNDHTVPDPAPAPTPASAHVEPQAAAEPSHGTTIDAPPTAPIVDEPSPKGHH